MRNGSLEGVLAEAAARQVAGRRQARPAPRGDRLGPGPFGLQLCDRGLGVLGRYALALQVEADGPIAVTTGGERLCARRREACVVDVPEPLQRLQGLPPFVLPHARALEPRSDVCGGTVTVLQRAHGDTERLAWSRAHVAR